jgi:hypothetical protein
MGSIVAIQFGGDVRRMLGTSFARRLESFDLTSLELVLAWVIVGLVLFQWRDRPPRP